SSSRDQTVKVWDVAAGKEVVTFHEHAAALSAAFSPDGLRIASGSADHTVKLWEPPTNGPRTLGLGRPGRIYNVQFSPDGRLVASGVSAGKIAIWDAISGKASLNLEGTDGYGRVAWSPDGKCVGSGNKVWILARGATNPPLNFKLNKPSLGVHHEMLGAGTAF